jgi:siderophore synthetase component
MAETDLDAVIRGIGKTQQKALLAEAKKRHARLTGLAAKAKTKEGKARFKQTAKDMMLLANAAARRLQITAENAADSYARAMKSALEEIKAAEAKMAAKSKPSDKSKPSNESKPSKKKA